MERERTGFDPRGPYAATGFEAGAWGSLFGYEFPYGLSKTNILEIGSGMSDIVANLRERAHLIVAIDPLYAEFKPSLYTLNDNSSIEEQQLDAFREVRERFIRDTKENSGTYIAATSTNLPFEGDTFDLVYSINTVSLMLGTDYPGFAKSVNEIVRVLKPGGKAILYPLDYHGHDTSTSRRFDSNRERFFKRLRAAGHKFNVQNVTYSDGSSDRVFTLQRMNRTPPFTS